MSISYNKNVATFSGIVSVEEAEGLLEWLQAHPRGRIKLAALTHLHSANLQLLMAAKPTISAWPKDEALAEWLRNSIEQGA